MWEGYWFGGVGIAGDVACRMREGCQFTSRLVVDMACEVGVVDRGHRFNSHSGVVSDVARGMDTGHQFDSRLGVVSDVVRGGDVDLATWHAEWTRDINSTAV